MGIFPDAQGQLTHKSLVGSCRFSNSPKLLCVSLLDERIKKIQLKMWMLERSKHIPSIFKMLKTANSKIKMCDRILTKCKLIQALIVVLIVCNNEEDPFEIESTRVVAIFLPL